jgi:hypothetical protein
MKDTITIEISSDTADQLFNDMLIRDYKMIWSDIQALQNMPKLADFQREDLENSQQIIAAMAVMAEYYIGHDWQERVIG